MENVYKYDWEENSYDDNQKRIMEEESVDYSSFEIIPYQAVQYYQNYSRDIELEMPEKDVHIEYVPNEQVKMVKSCLRRPNSIRKWLNLKVSFNISMNIHIV